MEALQLLLSLGGQWLSPAEMEVDWVDSVPQFCFWYQEGLYGFLSHRLWAHVASCASDLLVMVLIPSKSH